MRPPTADLSNESTLLHCDLLEPLSDEQIAELAARAATRSLAEDTTVLVIPAADAGEVFLREPAAGYAVMKKLAGTVSVRLRDIKEELIELLGD
jgi:hypothetical protein